MTLNKMHELASWLRGDFVMLQEKVWVPDDASVAASIEICDELLAGIEVAGEAGTWEDSKLAIFIAGGFCGALIACVMGWVI